MSSKLMGKNTGINNAMSDPEARKKVGLSKVGRRRVNLPDGTFKYVFPTAQIAA